jgi:predicted metal-binding membrane protein
VRALSRPVPLAALVLAGALAAWIITVQRMRGMDAGPGTDLGGLGWYVGIWVTMTAAMMLPSSAPVVVLFARAWSERTRGAALLPTGIFVSGYLAVWTAYGLAAYGVYRAAVSAGTGWLAWDRAGPYVAGGALVAAGLYQLTPLKGACLRHCRSPLGFLLRGRLGSPTRAFRLGVEHGGLCIGCCSGLMLALFALGVMSLFWMAVVAAAILVEKVAPHGDQLVRAVALALVALGIWVAAAPGGVPGLTQPDRVGPSMSMH